jgi:UDP-N-acetylmuramoylalanine--D-glutamate ligase
MERVTVNDGALQADLGRSSFAIDLRDTFHLPGAHHALNAAAASAAALAVGAGETAIRKALGSFSGLPHRLQFLGEFHGRRFYDDSKATTPEAAIAALEAFDQPVILLAGGYDKHVDLAPFADCIVEHTKAVALLGQTAAALQHLIADHASRLAATGGGAHPHVNAPPSFTDAVHWAIDQSTPGDVILLSPGCASYGWFPNYVARGQAFTELVRAWSSCVVATR